MVNLFLTDQKIYIVLEYFSYKPFIVNYYKWIQDLFRQLSNERNQIVPLWAPKIPTRPKTKRNPSPRRETRKLPLQPWHQKGNSNWFRPQWNWQEIRWKVKRKGRRHDKESKTMFNAVGTEPPKPRWSQCGIKRPQEKNNLLLWNPTNHRPYRVKQDRNRKFHAPRINSTLSRNDEIYFQE